MNKIKCFAACAILLIFILVLSAVVFAGANENPQSEYYASTEPDVCDVQSETVEDSGSEYFDSDYGIPDSDMAESDDDLSIEELIAAMMEEIESLHEQVADLQFYVSLLLDSVFTAPTVDLDAISRQITQTAVTERFMLRIEYYNACLILINTDLLNRQLELTEQRLEVERVRLSLGESTQNNVDVLNAHVNGLRRRIESNNQIFNSQRRLIETRRGIFGYEFIRNFEVPSPGLPVARSAAALQSGLIANNASLHAMTNQLNQQNETLNELLAAGADEEIIRAVRAEIQGLNAQRTAFIRQLELSATAGWSAYISARTQHEQAEAMRPMLNRQLALTNELFALGEISALERMSRRYAVYEELHAANMARITLAMAVAELNVMMEGVSG